MVGNLDGSKEVHRHGMVEIVHRIGEVIGEVVAHKARVVEHEVHLHSPAVDFGEGCINFSFVLEVAAHGADFNTILLEFGNHRFGMGLVAPLQNDVRTEFRHFDSGETANPAATAGDQGPFALHIDHIHPSFSFLRRNNPPRFQIKNRLSYTGKQNKFSLFCIQE